MSTTKKHSVVLTVLAAVVTVVGGVLIWRYIKGKNKKPPISNPDSSVNSPASKPIISPSSFPIKNGSRNDLVKQLQSLLGVSSDGIFGPKTQAALLSQTGKISIASQAEYDKIIADLKNKPAIVAGQSRAENLTAQWRSNPAYMLMAISSVSAVNVIRDAKYALQPTGKSIRLTANVKLSRYDYQPVGTTTSGYLEFDILNGALKGKYKVDAAKMTVA